jgi:hypothetical protein
VPAHARHLAAQLSALFERDVEIVKRLNDAHHRLADANELLWSGLAPDAFGLIDNGAAAPAIGTSRVAALIRDGGPAAHSQVLAALQNVHQRVPRGFIDYQNACEQRRQLAVDVGELSQQAPRGPRRGRLERAGGPAGHRAPSRPSGYLSAAQGSRTRGQFSTGAPR